MVGARPPFVLLDDSLSADGTGRLFENPVAILRCDDPAAAGAVLRELAAARKTGLYAAGFLSYELGYALEPKLAELMPADRGMPLIWMGLFETCRRLDAVGTKTFLAAQGAGDYAVADLRASLDEAAYMDRFCKVKEYIAAGDVYQVNLTFRYDFEFTGDPLALYRDLRHRQPVAHGAIVAAEDFHILSLSPELFLRVDGDRIETRPMKGTAPRGRTPAEDAANRDWLAGDPKSRAENLMIVDLLRNDIGRVARIGSVEATDMFTVETYRSIHQMISRVAGRLRPEVSLADLVCGLFPCGSVTGAPKIRAMEIIRELEPHARGVYTGSIGMIAPDGDMDFNVAIRTLAIDASGRGEMGIGSGLVHDSDGPAEYAECFLKGRFLTDADPAFALIETLRWTRGEGYYLLDRHLERLAASAAYFDYPCDLDVVRERLARTAVGFAEDVQRVRLTLDADGAVEVTAVAIDLPAAEAVFRYAIANIPTNSADRFLYHKTTRRELYDRTLAEMKRTTGCDEVLFVNERGELTEGSFTNLFVERDGVLLTPPVSCGLLDGTFRQALFADGTRKVKEAVLRPKDLDTADTVYLGNSVRGLVRTIVVDEMDCPK